MRRALPLLLLPLLACGGGGSSADAVATAPLSWSAGDRVVQLTVSEALHDRTTPTPPFAPGSCETVAHFGAANGTGERPRIDEAGPCILTNAPAENLGDLAAFDAVAGGTVLVDAREPGDGINVAITDTFPPPSELPCETLQDVFRVVSFGDEIPDDPLPDFEAMQARGNRPTILEPTFNAARRAEWPTGDVFVEWTGRGAPGIEVRIDPRDGAGPTVQCFAPDDGFLVVPSRIVDAIRDRPAVMEVTRVTGGPVALEGGLEVRITTRSSEAIFLETEIR